MNQISPIESAADQLYALLAVIADPAAHKARLDELVEKEKAAAARIAELNDMASETRRLHSTAQATNIVSDNKKAALEAREAELAQRAENSEREYSRQKQALADREQKLQQREANLARREADLEKAKSEIASMQQETRQALDRAEAVREKLQRQAAAVQVAMAQ